MQLSLGLSLVQLSRDGRKGKYDPWGVYDVLNPPLPHPAFLQTCANSPPGAAVCVCVCVQGGADWGPGWLSRTAVCVSSCRKLESHDALVHTHTPIWESSSRENMPSRIPLLSRSFHFAVCSLSQHPFLCFTDCFSLCLPSFLGGCPRMACTVILFLFIIWDWEQGVRTAAYSPDKEGKKALFPALFGN